MRTRAEIAAELVSSVADPLIRSSFRNMYAHWLALSARYSEAAALVDELLDDIARSRLDFAEPYALVSAATAAAGMRRWSEAHSYIDRAFSCSSARAKLVCGAGVLCRSSSCLGSPRQATLGAIDRGAQSWMAPSHPSEEKCLPFAGLVLATIGRVDEACSVIDAVRGTTAAVEATVLSAALEAVVALKRRDPRRRRACHGL